MADNNKMKQVVNRAGTMEGMIEAAIKLLEGDDLRRVGIPNSSEFRDCSGIVILESVQAGFLFTAQMGTGILLRHNPQGNEEGGSESSEWSPPLAIGLTGVGAGLAMGAAKKHMVVFLNNEQMTKAMSSDFSLRLSLQNSIVLLLGGETHDATAQVDAKGHCGVSSGYTSTLGVYCGPTAEGAIMAPRTQVNENFYQTKNLRPKDILFKMTKESLIASEEKQQVVDKLHTKLQELAKHNK